MSFTKQNNPLVIAALILVLLGAVVIVFQQVKKVQAAMAASRAAPKPEQDNSQPSNAPARLILVDNYARPAFQNDPFRQPPDIQPPSPPLSPSKRSPILPAKVPALPLLASPIPALAVQTAPSKAVAAPAHAADEVDPANLRVTAILKGTHATAIIEGAGSQPLTVAEGSRIGAYRVAAIGDTGIVLAGPAGIQTVALGSAAETDKVETPLPSQEIVNVAH